MGSILLRHADVVYACDDRRRTITDGYVHIEDGRIAVAGVDEMRVLEGANAAARRLLEAARQRTGMDFARPA